METVSSIILHFGIAMETGLIANFLSTESRHWYNSSAHMIFPPFYSRNLRVIPCTCWTKRIRFVIHFLWRQPQCIRSGCFWGSSSCPNEGITHESFRINKWATNRCSTPGSREGMLVSTCKVPPYNDLSIWLVYYEAEKHFIRAAVYWYFRGFCISKWGGRRIKGAWNGSRCQSLLLDAFSMVRPNKIGHCIDCSI